VQPEAAPPPVEAPPPSSERDPYRLDPGDVAEPPRGLGPTVRRIGPGIILAASIVGSGELIATTVLGAQVGYTALWLIVLSCLIKPIVQAELGRYTIATGEPALESFDRVPGPRAGVRWTVWGWAVMILMTQLQVGAMFGGIAQVMHLLVPALSVNVWVIAFLVLTLALLLGGGYERIERLAMVKVGLFTLLTFLAAVLLMRRPDFHFRDIAAGLRFELPPKGLATAVAVFGMTGVGTGELFQYPYWCVEKGYARFAGRLDGSAAWAARARGWVRVMHFDIVCSLIIYTVATLAFYLLGAGVLHPRGLVPAASDLIVVLSRIYTETLGPWALYVFYAGAIVTLYGTIFAATAAHSRMYADMARLMGRYARGDHARRVAYRRSFVVLLTIVPVVFYFVFQSPVRMVVAGGLAQSIMLPVAALGTVYLRHRHLPAALRPRPWVTAGLWLSTAVITAFMVTYLVQSLHAP
jgi:Mn2+/Fe2+ NRAMP family transporter